MLVEMQNDMATWDNSLAYWPILKELTSLYPATALPDIYSNWLQKVGLHKTYYT